MRRPWAARAISLAGAVFVCGVALLACELLVDASHLDTGRGDASAPLDAPGDGPLADGACPGRAGPAMVRVGAYCIDSTEVTNQDYMAFLADPTIASINPPQCAWKAGDYSHHNNWMEGTPGPMAPAGNVDWCDAYAFCIWAGKRLCGNIAGGSVPYLSWADSTMDQWYAACSGADASVYPYGNTFNENTCDGRLADGGFPDGASTYQVGEVSKPATCQGAYPGVFDLSGNAAEWEDCCDETSGGDAAAHPCRPRGGSANSSMAELRCDAPSSFPNLYARSSLTDDLGFRCCAP